MVKVFKVRFYWLFLLGMLFFSCKKSEERTCMKSSGLSDSIEIPIDSVQKFYLYKNLRYRIIQDDTRKIIVRGGANVIPHISVTNDNGFLSVHNLNRCNFLRKSEDVVEVEIHYPNLKDFYFECSDSVIFENTITGDSLFVEVREGGGSMVLDVQVDFLKINVSYGTGDYTLSGNANNAEVKIQNNGFADASQFNASSIFVYSNSTGNLQVNLQNSQALVVLEGTGNIFYTGNPYALVLDKVGSGELIKL